MKIVVSWRKQTFISVCVVICLGLLVSCTNNNLIITQGTFAPDPKHYPHGIVQVYAARTRGAKKAVSVHTWISVKRSDETEYTSYEIIGWRLRRNDTALVVRHNMPDRDWWGHQPELLLDYRKSDVDEVIDSIKQAVNDYPYKGNYQAYPGPNSNTFTAMIAKKVPELGLDLPSTAIGKDYRPINNVFAMSPSGTGVQASLFGLLSITLAKEEGLELNILGFNIELDLFDLAIELPGVGRIGSDPAIAEPLLEDVTSTENNKTSRIITSYKN